MTRRPLLGAIAVVVQDGHVLLARRRKEPDAGLWGYPGGHVELGETALAAAARELLEETGVTADKVTLIAEAPEELLYDLPPDMVGKVWKGKYRGQRQRWFLFRFDGEDADIRIDTEHPEFRAWRWADPADLPRLIVPFKKQLYTDVLAAFAEHLPR